MKVKRKQRATFDDYILDILNKINYTLSNSNCFEIYDEVKPAELIVGLNFKMYLKVKYDICNRIVLEHYNRFKYPYGFIVCEGYLVDNMNPHINPITLELINEIIMNNLYYIPLNLTTIKSILKNKQSSFKDLLLLNYIKKDNLSVKRYLKYLKYIETCVRRYDNRMIDLSPHPSKYLYKISLHL